MTREEVRVTLTTMKQNEVVSLNGFEIKKKGTQWIAKKGDYFKRGYQFSDLDLLIDRLTAEEEGKKPRKQRRAEKKAKASEKKATKKSNHEAKKLEKKAEKQSKKDARKNKRAQKKKLRKRNRFTVEVANLIFQGLAYFGLFLYYFTGIATKAIGEYSLGDYALYILAGLIVAALVSHVAYVRQLGKRHRTLNVILGVFEMLGFVAVAAFIYGPLTIETISWDVITWDVIVESVQLAFEQVKVIMVFSFVAVKWVIEVLARTE